MSRANSWREYSSHSWHQGHQLVDVRQRHGLASVELDSGRASRRGDRTPRKARRGTPRGGSGGGAEPRAGAPPGRTVGFAARAPDRRTRSARPGNADQDRVAVEALVTLEGWSPSAWAAASSSSEKRPERSRRPRRAASSTRRSASSRARSATWATVASIARRSRRLPTWADVRSRRRAFVRSAASRARRRLRSAQAPLRANRTARHRRAPLVAPEHLPSDGASRSVMACVARGHQRNVRRVAAT